MVRPIGPLVGNSVRGVGLSEAGTSPQTASPISLRQALSVPAESFPHVHAVKDYAVLGQIGRLRHLQYVETQRKKYPPIVLDRDCLVEPEDFAATNIYAGDAGGVTCAMRIGEIGNGPYGECFCTVPRSAPARVPAARRPDPECHRVG